MTGMARVNHLYTGLNGSNSGEEAVVPGFPSHIKWELTPELMSTVGVTSNVA